MAYKIGEGCSTCHYCRSECPVGAITFKGADYWIDPEKCTCCGICAEVCPSGIISDPENPVVFKEHEPITKKCDLLVLGAGGSGLVGAVRFAQLTGKKVIVIEKNRKAGGNTNLGHGFMLRYSKWHEAAGVKDTRDEYIAMMYEGAKGKLSKELIRKATYSLTDMFDWLCDLGGAEKYFVLKMGGPNAPQPPAEDKKDEGAKNAPPQAPGGGLFGPMGAMVDFPVRSFENLNCRDHSMGPGWMGTYVVRKMMEQCELLGIEVLTGTAAKKLLVSDDGIFKGVIAEDGGGEVRIDADCCLIATGGFSRNKEIMNKIRPGFYGGGFPVHSFSTAQCTGDAITMGEEIGAMIDLETVKIPMFGPTHHPYNYSVVRMITGEAIMVSLEGKRFQNEAGRPNMSYESIMEKLPGKLAYSIIDSNMVTMMGEKQLANTQDPETRKCYATYREDLEMECQTDMAAAKADTIEELAKKIRIDPAVLGAEVSKYNEFCKNSCDKDFGKDSSSLMPIEKAPFYAVVQLRFNEGAEGGLVNDDNLRVLRADGSPFNGIYTAGDCCKGLLKTSDDGGKFGEMPWAMASGYLSAFEMAEFFK